MYLYTRRVHAVNHQRPMQDESLTRGPCGACPRACGGDVDLRATHPKGGNQHEIISKFPSHIPSLPTPGRGLIEPVKHISVLFIPWDWTRWMRSHNIVHTTISAPVSVIWDADNNIHPYLGLDNCVCYLKTDPFPLPRPCEALCSNISSRGHHVRDTSRCRPQTTPQLEPRTMSGANTHTQMLMWYLNTYLGTYLSTLDTPICNSTGTNEIRTTKMQASERSPMASEPGKGH